MAHDAQAFDFFNLSQRIGNHPMTANQLRRDITFIGDRDRIGKGIFAHFGPRLLGHVLAANRHLHTVNGHTQFPYLV